MTDPSSPAPATGNDEFTDMTRAELAAAVRTLTAGLAGEQAAHAETREQCDAAELSRQRTRTQLELVLNESRATKQSLDEANLAAWRAKRDRRYARIYAGAAGLIAVAALIYAATD